MSATPPTPNPGAAPDAKQNHFLPLALVTSLFCCSGLTHNLLPVLIPKLKAACELTNTESMYVDVAQWMAYFLMAFPAAVIMRRFGFRIGIIAGLLVAAGGFLLFIPAAHEAVFPLFLTAFFISASGLVFLETAANPYISVLGDPARAPFRLNVAQSFYGLAAVVAALWVSKIIIKPDAMTETAFQALDKAAQKQHLLDQAAMVVPPYMVIGGVMLLLAVVFFMVRLPELKGEENAAKGKFNLLAHPLLIWGIVAQFFYVGAQVGVDATFLNYTHEMTGLSIYDATTYLGLILGCFFLGRITGTALMSGISASVILGVYAVACGGLLALCAMVGKDAAAAQTTVAIPAWIGLGEKLVFTSHKAPYLLMGVKFFMSIMYPTIFAIAVRGLGHHTKTASSFLVMSIVGGALVPLVMGKLADATGSFQPSYWVLSLCLLPVLAFAVVAHGHDRKIKLQKTAPEAA